MAGQFGETKQISQYKQYYKEQLQDGLEYQDFVAEQLYKIGLPLFNYASKKYQIKCGENKLGVEIKHDKKFKTTGNLWIEISEKACPTRENYVISGIRRNDNTWLYVIGNEEKIYIFSKVILNRLFESGRYKKIENNTKTSVGFLMPLIDANKYASKIIYVKQN